MTFGKLYGFKENPRTIPHIILAKYAGLDVELVFESPIVGFSQEYLKDFPKAKIPAFKSSDGYVLTETIAIAIYRKYFYINPLLQHQKMNDDTK